MGNTLPVPNISFQSSSAKLKTGMPSEPVAIDRHSVLGHERSKQADSPRHNYLGYKIQVVTENNDQISTEAH